MHGRLYFTNGIPLRIGVPATGRVLQVANDELLADPLVQLVRERPAGARVQFWGDWFVCPLAAELPGEMRPVSLCSGRRVVVEEDHDDATTRRSYRLAETWRERDGAPRWSPFVPLAEARTAARPGEPMAAIGAHLFAPGDLARSCDGRRPPVSFRPHGPPPTLRVGVPFRLADLGVAAHDDAGRPHAPFPASIDVEEVVPPVIAFDPAAPEIVTPLCAGTARFLVHSLCPGQGDGANAAIIEARVEP